MVFSLDVSYSFVIVSSIVFAGVFCETAKTGMPLNDFIHHFEPLFYDHHHLREQHKLTGPSDHFSVKFAAHQRLFHLKLRKDSSVFAEDTEITNAKSPVAYDTSRVLTGYVEGEDGSLVEAVVTSSGLLNALVKVGSEDFYIEPAVNYLEYPQDFHSVIYKVSDVHFPQENFTCFSHLIHPFKYGPVLFGPREQSSKHTHKKMCKSKGKCFISNLSKHRQLPQTGKRLPHHKQKLSRKKRTLYFHNSKKAFHHTKRTVIPHKVHTISSSPAELLKVHGRHNKYRHRATSKAHLPIHSSMYVSETPTHSPINNSDVAFTHILSNTSVDSLHINSDESVVSRKSKPFSNVRSHIYSRGSDKMYVIYGALEKDFIRSSRVYKNQPVFLNGLAEVETSSPGYVSYKNRLEKPSELSHSSRTNLSVKGNYKGLYLKDQLLLKGGHVHHSMSTKQSIDTHYHPEATVEPYATDHSFSKSANSDASTVSSTLFSQTTVGKKLHTADTEHGNPPYWRELDALHYTEDGRAGSSEPYGVRSIQRTQWTEERGQRHIAVDRRKSTCLLYLQADHLFYQRMGSEEACIEAMTRHVQRVNSIYRTTDFDQDGRPDNISFLIKRIKVHTTPDSADYRFVGSYGVEQFLELFSEDDYDAFCLAYMFTYRDFEGGTLGLAWTGDLKNAGGVCEKNGHYRGSLKSLNTGIITLLNYGKHVPPVVSHVTLAHEIGHNFGSPHDPEDDQHCTPGGEHGNYIMFARATSGDKKNNNKFSPCSLRSINAVLNTKARSVKGCFTEPLDAVCGNEIVEGTEECDCGWEEDCHEPCCFPMRVNPPQDQPPCRLRPAAFCSPSQGPCCSHDCRLKYGVICREDNGCRTASYCDGQGPQCPPSTKKPNKTICSEEFVCYNGECTGSICMAYGLESCQCLRTVHDPLIRSCELCCRLPGDDLSCKSSFEWNMAPYDVPDLYAKPGAPCDNYNGYCDVHQSCREIDPSGPLATLRKLLLSPEGAVILKRWLAERWWSVLLLFSAITLTVAISVRLLSHGPQKNFLSTILPRQRDFNFCRTRPATGSHATYVVAPNSRTTNCMSRPRVTSAPENGWV